MVLTRRLLASVLVLAVLGLQLGPALHLSAVRHATCAEHGDEVELPTLVASAVAVTRTSVHVGDSPAAHAHEHCVLGRAARAHASASGERAHLTVRLHTIAVALTACAPPPPSIALLSLAPKLAPPA